MPIIVIACIAFAVYCGIDYKRKYAAGKP